MWSLAISCENYKLEKKLEKNNFSVPEDICCETMSFYSKVWQGEYHKQVTYSSVLFHTNRLDRFGLFLMPHPGLGDDADKKNCGVTQRDKIW